MARMFGPSFEAVYFQRYDLTLKAYLAALDLERRDGLRAQHDVNRMAALFSLGVGAGSELKREIDKFTRKLSRAVPRGPARPKTLDDYMDFPLVAKLRKRKVS